MERQIRTYVPIAVGFFISRLIEWLPQVDIDGEGLTTAVTGLVIAIYYAIGAQLEKRYPWARLILGAANSTLYPAPPEGP